MRNLNRCLIDGHVHIHPTFSLEKVLDAAKRTMEANGNSHLTTGYLFLTEISGVSRYDSLPDSVENWQIFDTSEAITKLACDHDDVRIYLVAGRQVVSTEGLEVLIHGAREFLADGAPLEEIISEAKRRHLLAVLPWGFGKWTGRRRDIIRALISRAPECDGLFLADSGVRMQGSQRPEMLSEAEAKGWRVLAGSDPLPLPHQEESVGRYGFIAECEIDPEQPFAALSRWLRHVPKSPECYGTLTGQAAFLKRQVQMQMRKRFG